MTGCSSSISRAYSTPQLDTPFDNPPRHPPAEVRVIDPTHPLFGRSFPLRDRWFPLGGQRHVLVVYREGVYVRLPWSATDLAEPGGASPCKLTAPAVAEIVTLAERCLPVCPSPPKPSGTISVPTGAKPSLTS